MCRVLMLTCLRFSRQFMYDTKGNLHGKPGKVQKHMNEQYVFINKMKMNKVLPEIQQCQYLYCASSSVIRGCLAIVLLFSVCLVFFVVVSCVSLFVSAVFILVRPC